MWTRKRATNGSVERENPVSRSSTLHQQQKALKIERESSVTIQYEMPHNKSGFMSPKQNYLWIWKLDTRAIWYHFCTKMLKISSIPRFKRKWENETRRENWKNPSSRSFVWSCQEKWWYLVLFTLYSLAKMFLFFFLPEICHVLGSSPTLNRK